MSTAILFVAVMFWILPIFVAVSIGRGKDRAGFGYGFFLGWLGVIILALLPRRYGDKYGECPHCRELLRVDARVCPHCQREVTPLGPDGQPDYSAWAAEESSNEPAA